MDLKKEIEDADEEIRELRAGFNSMMDQKAEREAQKWQEAEQAALEEADREALENKNELQRTMKEKKDRFDRATIIKADYTAAISAMETRVDGMADGQAKTDEEAILNALKAEL